MKLKQKLPYALLAGFVPGFLFFFFGVLDIFAGNREEFLFAFRDFGIHLALIAAGVSILLTLLLAFAPDGLFRVLFGLSVWVTVMGYVQGAFLNARSGALTGDGSGGEASVLLIVIDTALWILIGIACILGAIKMKKHTIIRSVAVILLLMICGMQLTSCATELGEIRKDPFETRETTSPTESTAESTPAGTETDVAQTEPETPSREELAKAYLTTAGLTELSAGKNIVVFVLDRFDVSYYEDIVERDPNFFAPLTGFTYFRDNISAYSRTYPGVASMITGLENDFAGTMDDYFAAAYTTSPFLRDLKENHYKIKLYTANYYAYKSGAPLYGIADNLSVATDYEITDRAALLENLLALSAYRYLPTVAKSAVNVSSASFSGIVEYNGNAPLYELDDAKVFAALHEAPLTLDDSENSYMFLHLSGCHDPYIMDENGNPVEKGTELGAARGCFKLIYDYIDEMKRLGVYDDATIVITGDHPRARDDAEIPTQPRLTALFVKPAGAPESPLAYSDAQVSQENLVPTLVRSAGLETENAYGRSYFDISAGETVARHHNFELWTEDSTHIVRFRVSGDGEDFENWEIESDESIGSLYQ